MQARWLYPRAGRDGSPLLWNRLGTDDAKKRRMWEDDVEQQLAEDRKAFARYFRPNWDLRTTTGKNALRAIQSFVRDALRVVHWDLPENNEGVRQMLCRAVEEESLIPVVNREYHGLPRAARSDPVPLTWPARKPVAAAPEIISYIDFVALQRANGRLGGPSGDSRPLGDASPFAYHPDVPDDGVVQLAGSQGTPRNNQAQNAQFRAVVKALGLNPSQARQLHEEISKQGLGYHEMLERGRDIFGEGQ